MTSVVSEFCGRCQIAISKLNFAKGQIAANNLLRIKTTRDLDFPSDFLSLLSAQVM